MLSLGFLCMKTYEMAGRQAGELDEQDVNCTETLITQSGGLRLYVCAVTAHSKRMVQTYVDQLIESFRLSRDKIHAERLHDTENLIPGMDRAKSLACRYPYHKP